MAQSVSNDALWEKLSEVDKKMDQLVISNKTSTLDDQNVTVKFDFQKDKDEIISKLEKYIQGLGTHCDSHFKTMYKYIEQLEERTDGIYKVLGCMWSEMEDSKTNTKHEPYLNFKLFKLRKSSLAIAVLGLLVFILTLFCMKQQNDYMLLMDEYYRQSISVRAIRLEADSLRNNAKPETSTRKK